MKKLLGLLAVFLFASHFAYAADTTLAVTPGSGTTIVVTPDGLGNVIPHSIPCDHLTPTQCAAINSSGQIAIQAPPSLPLPSGASTAANQATLNTNVGSPSDSGCAGGSTSACTVDGRLLDLYQAPGPAAPSNSTSVVPGKAALTIAGCTIGVSSATCLAANNASSHLQIQNVTSGTTNYIACTFGGTAILNDKSSFMLAPIAGAGPSAANWGGATGVVPTGALNCIATSASAQLYVEYN